MMLRSRFLKSQRPVFSVKLRERLESRLEFVPPDHGQSDLQVATVVHLTIAALAQNVDLSLRVLPVRKMKAKSHVPRSPVLQRSA
jgi:hypothetical protein